MTADAEREREPLPLANDLETAAIAYMMNFRIGWEDMREGVRRAKADRGVEILERLREAILQEGMAEGERIGTARGEIRGRVRMFVGMLNDRFGHVPETAVSRLHEATAEQLDRWAIELLDAELAERRHRFWVENDRSPPS